MNILKVLPLVAVFALSGCSSQSSNPLKTHSQKVVFAFLHKAEKEARSTLGVNTTLPAYVNCNNNPSFIKGELNCKDYYQAMLKYAHTTQDFKHLTYGQLTDSNYIKSIGQSYIAETL